MYIPEYRITPYLLNLIDEASRLRGSIEEAAVEVVFLPALQKEAKARATQSSTSIEGNPLSLNQVKALARGEKIGAYHLHEKEAHNYLKALHWIEKNGDKPITEELIFNLHQMLTKNILDEKKCGKYKSKQNYIVNEKGVRTFTPPPPKETPGLVKQLIEWVNSHEAQKLHSVLVCAIFHHRFVSIHPFSDGNGRAARLLGTFILYQRGFDTNNIFSLDDYFAGNRKRYYEKIEQSRELDNNLTFWIEYVAEGIVETLKATKKRIEDLQISSKHKTLLSSKQEELVRVLRDNPPLYVSQIQADLKVTRARINQIIVPLIKSGIISTHGKGRATRYRLN